MQPRGVEAGGQGEAVVAGLGAIGVEAKLPGIVPRAEEAGVLPGPGERALDQPGRQATPLGTPSRSTPHAVEHGRVAREIVARGDAIQVARPARIGRLAGQHAVDGQQVVPLGMRHRADDRQLAGPRRQAGQVLAHPDARHRRLDRLELAAHPLRRLGLHVERVVLPQPAAEQNHDHRPRPPRSTACRHCGLSRRQQSRQSQSHQPGITHLEERSACRQVGAVLKILRVHRATPI